MRRKSVACPVSLAPVFVLAVAAIFCPCATAQFFVPPGLEVTVWAKAPMFYNPTNIDVDMHGRVWVAEAVNYRLFNNEERKPLIHPKGDRIMVLTDTDGDGKADRSHVFVQDKDLVAPLGVAVFGNRVVVSCSPSILLYTDVDGDAKFDPKVDKKDVFLTGFGGLDHDHGLHSVVGGPDGYWYFNAGNAGPHIVTDRSGFTLRIGSWYTGGTPHNTENTPGLKSDDGRVYVGGFAARIKPDGTGLTVIGHNFRNNYEIAVDSFGEVWQNDNDDEVQACRTSWLMPFGNAGYSSADGQRNWRADRRPGQTTPIAHWHQEDPGVMPFGDLYGAGSPTGICVYENGALPEKYRGVVLSCEAGRNVVFGYHRKAVGAGFELRRFHFFSSTPPEADDSNYKWNDRKKNQAKWFRPSDVCVGADGCIYVADWFDPVVGGHQMDDRKGTGTIYRIHPKGSNPKTPEIDLRTDDGIFAALRCPAPNVRFVGEERWRRRLVENQDRAEAVLLQLAGDASVFVAARAKWLFVQIDRPTRAVTPIMTGPGRPLPLQEPLARALTRSSRWPAGRPWNPAWFQPTTADIREFAVHARDVPFAKSKDLLLQVAAEYDGEDRNFLEAFGIGCDGKEEALYPLLLAKLGGDALAWSDKFADLVWRLHPKAAVAALQTRTLAKSLKEKRRRQAIDSLAFIPDKSAAEAMLRVALEGPADLRSYAAWWLRFRDTNHWRAYRLALRLDGDFPAEAAFASGVLTKGKVAKIDVAIRGAKKLFLMVTDAGNGNSCDWADWAEPRLVSGDVEHKLTEMPWSSAKSGWGKVQVNKSCEGTPLRVNGVAVPYGIGTHAESLIVYDLPEGHAFERFRASVGLDNGSKTTGGSDHEPGGRKASVEFFVYHDGETPTQRAMASRKVLLDATATRDARERAAREMAKSKAGGAQLMALAAAKKIPAELAATITRHIHGNPDVGVRAIAGKYFPLHTSSGKALPPITELAEQKGDAKRGRALFFGRATCSACHLVGKEGAQIGPDLTRIGGKLGRIEMLDALLNPSAAIAFGFEPWMITKKDDTVVTGMLVGAGDPVLIKDVNGRQHAIAAKDIVTRERLDVSLMLPATSLALTAQDLADLTDYLLERR